jgi:CotS family spore coat protein
MKAHPLADVFFVCFNIRPGGGCLSVTLFFAGNNLGLSHITMLEGVRVDDYRIKRWDSVTENDSAPVNLEQYVPPEVEEVARGVMEFYDMQVHSMVLITAKPDKGGAIWKIETDQGPRSLKLLHRNPARSMFSVGAQEYLVGQGARVPALIRTRDGSLYAEAGGKLWIVTDWIEELQQASKIDLEGAQALCFGLGEFHRLSKGYVPPESAQKASRLSRWPKHYAKIATKLGWFKQIAEAYSDIGASESLLAAVARFEEEARAAIVKFSASDYAAMVGAGEPYWGLVHQDYGWSNGQMGPGGVWVIDLDGVAYDLPIRDLRKLITNTMDDMGVWDIEWIRGMIEAYHRANPIDRQTFELLLIDMAFPNEFYKHVKEVVFEPAAFMQNELPAILQRIMTVEKTKWKTLEALAGDVENYERAVYPEPAAPFENVEETIAPLVTMPLFEEEPVPAEDALFPQTKWFADHDQPVSELPDAVAFASSPEASLIDEELAAPFAASSVVLAFEPVPVYQSESGPSSADVSSALPADVFSDPFVFWGEWVKQLQAINEQIIRMTLAFWELVWKNWEVWFQTVAALQSSPKLLPLNAGQHQEEVA